MRDTSVQYYKQLFETCEVLPEKEEEIKKNALLLLRFSPEYKKVAVHFGSSWEMIGLIHMMESSFDFKRGLHNGEPWSSETTLVPKGRGPFQSWEAAAIDALSMKTISTFDAGVGKVARFLEAYNGMGYAKYHDVNSPYLWSCSNHGVGVGKYVADGRYEKEAVSSQPGAMVVWKYLRDNLEKLIAATVKKPILIFNPSQSSRPAQKFQEFINTFVGLPGVEKLEADGFAGPKTSNMCHVLFGFRLYGDPSLVTEGP